MGTPRSRQSSRCKHGMALMSISFSAKSAAYLSSRSSDRSSSAMARFSAPSASGPGGPGGGGGGGPGRGGGGGGVSPQTGDGSGDTTCWWRAGVAATGAATRAPTRTASVTGCLQLGQLSCWRLNHCSMQERQNSWPAGQSTRWSGCRSRQTVHVASSSALGSASMTKPPGAGRRSKFLVARSSSVSHDRPFGGLPSLPSSGFSR